MAEEQKIAFTIEVAGVPTSINSLKDLKKAISDSQNQMLLGNKEAANTYNTLVSKLNEVKSASQSATSSGIENLTGAFNTFKDGLANADFGKISSGLKGLGAAMKAVPILLLVEGITYLIQNFEELSKGSGLLGKALRGIGAIIEGVKTVFYELGANIGLVNKELDDLTAKIEERSKTATKFLQQQNAELDRQIKLAKAAGKDTVDLELTKQEAIIITNKMLVEQMINQVRAGKALSEEQQKVLETSLEAIRNARTEEVVIAATAQQKIRTENQKTYDEAKKLREKELEEFAELEKIMYETELQAARIKYDEEQRLRQQQEEYNAGLDAAKQEIDLANYQKKRDLLAQEDADIMASIEARKQGYKELEAQKYELTKQGLQAAQALTDLYFNYQLKRAKGNEAEERRIKKKAFNVNKAFGIANAVIDGVGAVQKALNNPYPLNIVLAVLSGVLAAANVAKIASTKFDDGGSSAGGGGDIQAGGGALAGASAPAINQPNNTVTQLNEDGVNEAKKQPTQKVVVIESDITEKQKTVAKIEETATI